MQPTGISDWEPYLRLGAFLGAFAAMAAWEALAPRRTRLHTRLQRWTANLGLVALDSLVMRLAFPVAAVAFASLAADRGWGLLNAFALPAWATFVVAVVALDLAIYFQHVTFHAVPLLWRLHRVHHADPDLDVTTGARFHPVEILLSMAIKLAAIAVVGAPAVAVLAFEIVLNACAMFNHGNVVLPAGLERALRRVIVTPDMHRIHHSMDADEANSNYGFNLAWWDRLFGTYRAQASLPQERMRIGVEGLTGTGADVSLAGMLAMPWQDTKAASRAPDPRLDGAGEPT